MTIDGRPVDPRTGALIDLLRAVGIRATRTRRIPLSHADRGPHELTIRYQPDRDEAPVETSVSFTIKT